METNQLQEFASRVAALLETTATELRTEKSRKRKWVHRRVCFMIALWVQYPKITDEQLSGFLPVDRTTILHFRKQYLNGDLLRYDKALATAWELLATRLANLNQPIQESSPNLSGDFFKKVISLYGKQLLNTAVDYMELNPLAKDWRKAQVFARRMEDYISIASGKTMVHGAHEIEFF